MMAKPLTDDQAENLDALARDRRQVREGPSRFRDDNDRSKRRAMREPHGLDALLVWFLEGWSAETPEAMHGGPASVWVGRAGKDEEPPPEHLGGSLLGSPATAEPMRQLVENSPAQTAEEKPAEYEGPATPFFVRPMRAALSRMAGVGAPGRPSALMALNLRRLAHAGGDFRSVGFALNVFDDHVVRTYWEVALQRLYWAWASEPEARLVERGS